MDHGDWVEPQPMATTSLRLPADVIDQLKRRQRLAMSATPATCGSSSNAPPAAARYMRSPTSPNGWTGSSAPSPAEAQTTRKKRDYLQALPPPDEETLGRTDLIATSDPSTSSPERRFGLWSIRPTRV